ncbi:MAG: hypothetical protein KDJ77_11160 [Rhodobiaceae bacterium]|nr:hypothetical protein [Rhodobiaceae bacterium]
MPDIFVSKTIQVWRSIDRTAFDHAAGAPAAGLVEQERGKTIIGLGSSGRGSMAALTAAGFGRGVRQPIIDGDGAIRVANRVMPAFQIHPGVSAGV